VVKLAYDYYRYTGDIEPFASTADNLKRAMDSMPRHSSGLIWIDPAHPHTCFGFTDCVVKTGEELFSSLLYWEASRIMAELAGTTGDDSMVSDFSSRAQLIEKNIDLLWDDTAGAYRAAAKSGGKIDIWGNAYLVSIAFPAGGKRETICAFLLDNYDRYVYRGQIRHLLEGQYWEETRHSTTGTVPKDEYQNGGYWAVASGWVADALSQTDQDAASRLIDDLLGFFQEEGVYECINRAGWRKYKDYVASVVNPFGLVRRWYNVQLRR
jgi:hypothetical protein